ncbi:MAG: TackOD1 domain-containing metal-binding protein [Candidatus Bathycorpusculaceae bacterium]
MKKEERGRSRGRLSFNEINELMLGGADKKEEIELERRDAYIERPTQRLLRKLLESGKEAEMLPTYDPSYGFRYETAESVFEEATPERAEEFLERLSRLEILKKSFFDTVSACPACGSLNITLHYRCPKCGGGHAVKTGLTEHIPCGNIDEREKYIQGNCPKCGAKLAEGQFRDMGLWYICRGCGERFEHPQLDLICRKCGHKFKIENAKVQEISKYALNPEREQEIRQNVTSLESVSKLLTELEFTVEMPGSAVGEKSGIQHNFSLLAKKTDENEDVVTIDHAVGDPEVQALPLILYIYKISEVKVDLPIFVAIPKISETARKIAQGYNILLIEGNPQEKEQLEMLKEEIQNRLGAETLKKGESRQISPEVEKRLHSRREPRKIPPSKSLKPQLYTPTSTIHPETKSKRPLIDTIKKAIKRTPTNEARG